VLIYRGDVELDVIEIGDFNEVRPGGNRVVPTQSETPIVGFRARRRRFGAGASSGWPV
jgi:hypothetical protein